MIRLQSDCVELFHAKYTENKDKKDKKVDIRKKFFTVKVVRL